MSVAELIEKYRLLVRPSLITGNWIAGQWKGVSAVGNRAYCWEGSEVERTTLESAVNACVKRIESKEEL